MEKLQYVLRTREGQPAAASRDTIVGPLATRLQKDGARWLTAYVDDPEANVRPPSPNLTGRPAARALLDVWVEDLGARHGIDAQLRASGFDAAGYLVTESLYTDWGDNDHAARRSWPDGQRSPGIFTVAFLEKPARHDEETWFSRWYDTQSPVSEAMQPRGRYIRNAVVTPLATDAPPLRGIVAEGWADTRSVTNPLRFYGARNPLELAKNVATMLKSVTAFLDLHRIQVQTMSEYILVS